MHMWVCEYNGPWQKIVAFLESHTCTRKLQNNRFRVPIHFATNRFTFEKFPPPPPLLHSTLWPGHGLFQ